MTSDMEKLRRRINWLTFELNQLSKDILDVELNFSRLNRAMIRLDRKIKQDLFVLFGIILLVLSSIVILTSIFS